MEFRTYCILVTFHIISSTCFSDPLPLFADIQVINRNNSRIDELFSVTAQFGPRLPDEGFVGFIANAEPRNACVPILPPPDLPLTNRSVQWIAVIRRSPSRTPDTNLNSNVISFIQTTTSRPILSSKLSNPSSSYNFLWNLGHLTDIQPRRRVSTYSGENGEADCTFASKVLNAQRAGFNAAIIYNIESDDLIYMSGGQLGNQVNIPSVFVGVTAGEFLVTNYAYNKQPFIIRQNQAKDQTTATSSADLQFKAAPTTAPNRPRLDKLPEYHARIIEYSSIGFFAYLVPFVILIASLLCFLIILVVVKSLQDCRRARRSRLRPANLRKLPVRTFNKEDPECSHWETCAICLDDYQNGDKLRVLPCKHAYHKKCIDPWLLKSKRVCPICKARVPLSGRPAAAASGASTSNTAAQQQQALPRAAGEPSNEAADASPNAPSQGINLEVASGTAGESSNAAASSTVPASSSSHVANEPESDLIASDDDDEDDPQGTVPRTALGLGGAPSSSSVSARTDERTPLLRTSSAPAPDADAEADAEATSVRPRRVSFLDRLLRSARLRGARPASAETTTTALSVSADPERFSSHSYESTSAIHSAGVQRRATADGSSSGDLPVPVATASSVALLVNPSPRQPPSVRRTTVPCRLRRLFGGGTHSASDFAPSVEDTSEQPNSGTGPSPDAHSSGNQNPLV